MRKTLCWILGAALLAGLAGCDQSEKGTVSALNAEKPARNPFLVEASKPERRDISEYLTETGNITAERQVEVLAKGTGHCLEILVEEGDRVEKDQVLAEIDKAEMQVNIQQSRVNVKHQENIYRRTENGWKQGIFSEAEKDNAKSAFEQAQASLEMQEVQLTFLTIRAPIAGVITQRKLQAGMLVSTGMPVFSIVDPSSFILPIFVTERSLPRLKLGQEARVTIDSSGDREFVAKVRRINPGVDAQTGSVKVVLDFDPNDHEYLRESAFARYSLVMDTHTGVLVVPKDAIVEENARRYVMVAQRGADAAKTTEAQAAVDGGAAAPSTTDTPEWVAARVEVETGLEDSNYTEVLSGINDDTLVITLGQQTVNEGDWLEVGNLEETLKTRGEISAGAALDEVEKEKAAQEAETAARTGGS